MNPTIVVSTAVVSMAGLVAATGAGLSAGLFLAFSSFVMTGLGRAPVAVGIRAMQEINRAAPSPVFMIVLFGSGLLAVVVAVGSLVISAPGLPLTTAGAVAYVGCLVLTATYHVPRNDALALLDPEAPATIVPWHSYLRDWTRMNHVRAGIATLGCLLLIMGWSR